MENIIKFNVNNKNMFILKKNIVSVKMYNDYVEIRVNYNGNLTKYNIEPYVYESIKDLYNRIKQQFTDDEILLNYENWHEFFVVYNINGFMIEYGLNTVNLSLIFNENNISTMVIKDNNIGNNQLSESYKIISQLTSKINRSTIKNEYNDIQNNDVQSTNDIIESQKVITTIENKNTSNNTDDNYLTFLSMHEDNDDNCVIKHYSDDDDDDDDEYDSDED